MSGGVGVEGSCLGKGRQDRGLCRGPEVRSIEHLPGTRHFPFLSRRFSPPPWAGHLIRSPGSHRWLVEKPGFKPGHSDPKACVLSTASLWDGRFSEKWKEQSQTIRSQIHSKQQGAAPPGQGRAPTLSIDTSSPCTCPPHRCPLSLPKAHHPSQRGPPDPGCTGRRCRLLPLCGHQLSTTALQPGGPTPRGPQR